jgi:FKBP-type peptidyl-prolyl cis-trans isomerase FklB
MNRILMLLAVLWSLPGVGLAAGNLTVNGPDDEVSYSVGHQVGRDLARQGVNVNSALVLQGVLDATEGSEPLISYNQMLEALSAFRQRILAQAEQSTLGMRRAGEEFLKKNAAKKGVVTRESGLQYKILTEGKGASPKLGDQVTVNYVSRDVNGRVFDTTHKEGTATPVQFKLDNVLPGMQEGLQLMSEGGKYEFYIPHKLAYSDSTPLAGQAIIIELELLKVIQ